MKTMRELPLEPIAFPDASALVASTDGLARLYRCVGEFAREACDAFAGVFGMPLRQAGYDACLERLDTHTLHDIGCDRA